MTRLPYRRTDPRLGEFALRHLRPEKDADLLHAWLTHPKSVFWMMQDADRADVVSEFAAIGAHPYRQAFLGLHDRRPAFLAERYDPARVELAGLYDAEPGDVGMHFLCSPTSRPLHGFSTAVLTTVLEFLFTDPGTRRVVVEPDVANTAVHELNAAVGFRVVGTVRTPQKLALLSSCTRSQFRAARGAPR